MKASGTFNLMGHKWRLHIVAPEKWRLEECIGRCDTTARLIEIRYSDDAGMLAHTILHELTHAILGAMNHPLYEDEQFVDTFSGLLQQATSTFRETPARKRAAKVET